MQQKDIENETQAQNHAWLCHHHGVQRGRFRPKPNPGRRAGRSRRPRAVNSLDRGTRLSPQDVWDVTAYILSKDRPFDARFVKDWSSTGPTGVPNWLSKAPDAAYDYTMPRVNGLGLASDDPRFAPMFPLAQHEYGPFQPITDALAKAKTYWGY